MIMKNKEKQPLKSRIKRKLIICLSVFAVLIVVALLYLNFVVNPVIISTSSAKVKSLSQRAVENAVRQVIHDNVMYDTLIMITRDNNGKIVTISSNSATINMLSLELTDKAQSALSQMGATGIDIPIGSFSGMPIFTGRGPSVNIKMLPIGNIYCKFESTFTSAGINQTNHRIYLKVYSSVSVILPTANQVVKTETQIMISESIIVGDIPDTYLYSTSLDEMMNLIP